MNTKLVASLSVAAVALLAPSAAWAHTDSDVVAVPAGEEAVVKLKPTHGCAGSPTVDVAIQAPVSGAVAEEVEGWTATSTDDGNGKTVLEWKGGSLPADQTGEFPVEFTVPGTPGELLTFPSVQTCENGEELSWIGGDPASEFPAPRLLVLPSGSKAAATLDDVAADAPGRDQLAAIVDVDNPESDTTTTVPATETTDGPGTTTGPSTTTAAAPDDESAQPARTPAASNGDDGNSSNTPLVIGGVVLLIAAAGGGALLLRRKAPST